MKAEQSKKKKKKGWEAKQPSWGPKPQRNLVYPKIAKVS